MAFASANFDADSGRHIGARSGPRPLIDRLRLGSLWLVGASSGFVVIEPAPYEFLIMLAMIVFVATGLTLRAGHLSLLFLLIFYNIGFATSLIPVVTLDDTAKWTAVSCFLSVTTLFFAMALAEDTVRRTGALLRGYGIAALGTAAIAVLAYFRLVPGWEFFIHNLRATATFKDPNVFGPFLILPALIVMQRIMFGALSRLVPDLAIALIFAAALFLSFSRGAWGHFAASLLVLLYLNYVTTPSSVERMRIVIVAALGGVLITTFIIGLLSLDQVADLFRERASLVQDYDAGQTGRFGRHILGAMMILDHPFGIGPLQFKNYFPEDPHNSFLDAFMAGGWLGGCTFLALVVITLWIGFRNVFVRTPWQGTAIAVYAAFVGEVGESYIIDVQHWRHYYLIIGLIWGLALAKQAPVNLGTRSNGERAMADAAVSAR
jgi:O-antigen ligase